MWHVGMFSNMNFPAPVAALGFLAACTGTILAVCALAAALFLRKLMIAKIAFAIVAAGAVVYFGLLFGFSLGSRDVLLSNGQEKYFCEIDCHLAYSVVNVTGKPAGATTRYTVVLRTRFDETTISSRRPKDLPLTPSPRNIQLMDERGERYAPESASGTPLGTPLIPGQEYTTEIVFEVPHEARRLRLLINTTPQWPDSMVIGDENSWLHKKTYFLVVG